MSVNIKFSVFTIDSIKDFIENKLYLKLKRIEVISISDLFDIDNETFLKQKGVGENTLKSLIQLQDYIKNNEQRVLDYLTKKTSIINLPKNTNEKNFLENISIIVSTYCSFLKKPEYQKIIEKSYGISENRKSEYGDLAALFNYSSERVRQLKLKYIDEIQTFFGKGVDESKKIRIDDNILKRFNELKEEFGNKGCFVFDDFKKYIKDAFNLKKIDHYDNQIYLLLDILNFSLYGKLETNFTNANLVSTNNKNKKTFIKIGVLAIEFLKQKCIKVTDEKILVYIKKNIGNFENQLIINFLKSLPEIESFKHDDENLFQIQFQLLSKASDKAFRVLNERGEEMHISEIVDEINKIQAINKEKIFNRDSLALSRDKRFKPFGKTGYWTKSNDDKSTDKIENLILRALYRLDKPSSLIEILNEVKKERKNVNKNSIHILLSRICFKTNGNNYILKKWKLRYPKIDLKKKRKSINKIKSRSYRIKQIEDIIEFLKKKENGQAKASLIIKKLRIKSDKYTRQSFYKIFENENYFKKLKFEKNLIIRLKDAHN